MQEVRGSSPLSSTRCKVLLSRDLRLPAEAGSAAKNRVTTLVIPLFVGAAFMPKARRKPAYLFHRSTGQARVRINGKDFYLGEYDSPASKARYEELLAEWFSGGDASTFTITVDELCLRFMAFAAGYYRTPDGEPSSEITCLRYALRPLVKLFGPTLAREMSPKRLKAVQEALIANGHVRQSINRTIHRIRRVWKWGVSEELIAPDVLAGLLAVPPLRSGRSKAKDAEPILPVETATMDATLPFLPPTIADMVRLQLLLGCRPGELCNMRPCDVTLTMNGVWTYEPEHHKTQHHGKERKIFIGPTAQEILRPYLDRAPEAYCFSPAESEARRLAEVNARRVTPRHHGNGPGTNRVRRPKCKPGTRFTSLAYSRAVARACDRAFPPPKNIAPEKLAAWKSEHRWAPNQLRHARATQLRERFGIEAAQLVLGHSDANTTLIYAEKNHEKTAAIVRQIG